MRDPESNRRRQPAQATADPWWYPLWKMLLFTIFLIVLMVPSFAAGVAMSRILPGDELFWVTTGGLLAAVGAGWLMLARYEDRSLGALGFAWTSGTSRELAGGMAIGVFPLALVVGIGAVTGLFAYHLGDGSTTAHLHAVGSHLSLLAVAAAVEEAIFRGYPFQLLVGWIGPVAATVFASALFSFAHAFNPHASPLALVNIFLAGVMLSVAYLRTRSLWFATAVHLGWNWGMASLLALPVSGLDFFELPLYRAESLGPYWITGGEFGPEGGLLGTVAKLLVLWAVWKLPGLDAAPAAVAHRPLVEGRLRGTGLG